MSLHAWLLDYVFIPLGGSRRGEARVFLNVVLTFLLGGLWHGAGWGFAIMGLYNGLLVATWRKLRPRPSERRVVAMAEGFLSLNLIALSMVFMWGKGIGVALEALEAMTRVTAPMGGFLDPEALGYLAVAIGLQCTPVAWKRDLSSWFAEAPAVTVATAIVGVGGFCSLYAGIADAFYYFQF